MQIQHIALTDINEDAFPRDRSHLCPDTLNALVSSIRKTGLRHPIELCAYNGQFTLISGFCRLAAYKQLSSFSDEYTQIPAMVREPDTAATALLLMVEENAIRAEISPWDQARIALTARNRGYFDTLDAAINVLYQKLPRQKRTKLRAIASMVEALDGLFTAPDTLTQPQCLRLAAAIKGCYEDLFAQASETRKSKFSAAQW